MQLTENFSLREFTKSQTADRLGIDNTPPEEMIPKLTFLCTQILEPLRKRIEKPIIITSGYRCPELSKAIGSSENSQHCKGEAADIEALGMSTLSLAEMIINHFDFDQCILECYKQGDMQSGWVHFSLTSGTNRKEVLTYTKEKGYAKGLVI
ncbi:MAG: putative peptidase M15 [Prokaryotic dsDNA virus sp.]|nr:MAG: putative peptidase M15 [Prokaryotic dsDNA virus sp.]|tara:strand:- start:739 stop:1194 length:456 start_codon:yes stop_codon:yes gene_type:complete